MMVPGNQSGEKLMNALLKPSLVAKEENQNKESFTNTGLNPCFICRKEIKSQHKIYFS